MCRAIPEGEFTQSQIIQAAIKLVELEEAGTSYEQTLENLKNSAAELEKLEAAVAELRTEETNFTAAKRNSLKQTNAWKPSLPGCRGSLMLWL